MSYLFTSKRLGFRPWREQDLGFLTEMNNDAAVMQYFPNTLSYEESLSFLKKMQVMQENRGYCYYVTELLETKKMIGIIGFGYKDFVADFTPCVDIGWRLHHAFWGKGYATEGANRCLQFTFTDLGLQEIFCIAPSINIPSIKVMENIGLKKIKRFKHPQLSNVPTLEDCVLYSIKATEYKQNG